MLARDDERGSLKEWKWDRRRRSWRVRKGQLWSVV
jgi:hypothetical protein